MLGKIWKGRQKLLIVFSSIFAQRRSMNDHSFIIKDSVQKHFPTFSLNRTFTHIHFRLHCTLITFLNSTTIYLKWIVFHFDYFRLLFYQTFLFEFVANLKFDQIFSKEFTRLTRFECFSFNLHIVVRNWKHFHWLRILMKVLKLKSHTQIEEKHR